MHVTTVVMTVGRKHLALVSEERFHKRLTSYPSRISGFSSEAGDWCHASAFKFTRLESHRAHLEVIILIYTSISRRSLAGCLEQHSTDRNFTHHQINQTLSTTVINVYGEHIWHWPNVNIFVLVILFLLCESGWLNELGSWITNNSFKPITNTAWVRARLCKLQKRCTRLATASDKVYQLLSHGQWFSSGTLDSSNTKTGRHDVAEILLKLALNTKNQNQIVVIALVSLLHLSTKLFDRMRM